MNPNFPSNEFMQALYKQTDTFRDRVKQGLKDNRIIVDEETGLKYTKKISYIGLEEAILDCWSIIEDIDLVSDSILEIDPDRTKKMLEGLKIIYSLKFEKLWKVFEEEI